MPWEFERHEWSALRAQGSAMHIPSALQSLATAASTEAADHAYWRVDNTVVVQGALFEAAVATTTSCVAVLPQCTSVARPRILELLVQLGSGEPADAERRAGNVNIPKNCIRELARGVSLYLHILEHGTLDERASCIDLLGLSTLHDPSLRPQVEWYLEKSLARGDHEGLETLAREWLAEFRALP